MHLDHYLFNVRFKTDTLINYEFTSIGPRGNIKKVIEFSMIDDNYYNLAFGDLDTRTKKFIDDTTSGNNDHEKILATVAAVVQDFTNEHPDSHIYAEGRTPSRTRLYRICITKYWKDITDQFDIFGLQNGEWQEFIQNQRYNAFLGTRNHSKY